MQKSHFRIPLLFLIARLVLLLSLPDGGLVGYGDHWNFFAQAELGWPFFQFWTEFPPVFPFLSTIIYQAVSGREHAYQYLLAIILSLAQAGSLAVFLKLAIQLYPQSASDRRAWVYAILLIGLGYGWWYFDPLAVLAMLLGLYYLLQAKDKRAGLAAGVGVLIKWFPVFLLPLAWRLRPPRKALVFTLTSLLIIGLVFGVLWLLSPEFTAASMQSQVQKGSWETVWALLDGNLGTGNFGAENLRTDPATAVLTSRSPARVSPWLTILPFLALGAWLFWRLQSPERRSAIAFLGVTWCLFLLWSPGYSPQWVLYLLPLILLALPERLGFLMAVSLVIINLLEWPVLLSRGYFWALPVIIPIRYILTILLTIEFWKVCRPQPFKVSSRFRKGLSNLSAGSEGSGSSIE